MKKLSTSVRIYACLIIILAILGAISVFMPVPEFIPRQEYPASRPVIAIVTACGLLVIYGGLGLIGLILSSKLGFAEIWDKKMKILCTSATRVLGGRMCSSNYQYHGF